MSVESEPRSHLFRQLSALPKPQFEELLFALDVPNSLISSPTAAQGDRVADLLNWAKGPTGCGLQTIRNTLSTLFTLKASLDTDRTDFETYLDFIRRDRRDQDVRDLYTATEALIHLEAETVERQPERPEQDSEPVPKKVQRFPVLEGLRKYALGRERQHVLLAGRPGSGKSTTLKRLRLELADAG
jgi:hypothetical protein